ncbi:MAG: hypothetical protein QOD26_3158 [Betaproteobacteria bacterium]|jgi:hypothetical protein|nr:hypothetical protein [Betaproteobacteria bacterium]
MTAPIALFAYRRPLHLKRALETLAANPLAKASRLFIFCDAARDADARSAVQEVRRLARKAAGFAAVQVIERERNFGLAASIVDGVGRLTAEYGTAIVVEDDLVLAPRFLEFMNAALERYAGEPRVMQVSGYMYPCALAGAAGSGFLPSISCWGWATWKRAWQQYDASLSGWQQVGADPRKRHAFDMEGAYDYSGMLQRTRAGSVDSWGVVWYLSVFSRNGVVLYPRKSLVSNTGFDNSGTHTDGASGPNLGDVELWASDAPFEFPGRIEIDERYYDESRKVILGHGRGWRGWLRRLTRR